MLNANFPSDASSTGDDYISYNQQSFSTETPSLEANNFNDLDNYYLDEDEKENEDDAPDEDIESISNGKTAPKSFKNVEGEHIVYGDMDGDIILKGFNTGKWEHDEKESTTASSTASSTTTTTILPSTTVTSSSAKEQTIMDNDDEEGGFPPMKNGSNGYKNWLTNRKRRAHSSFEKYKAYHRNYRRFGHRGHKKAFGRYKKYEHHRSKHKSGMFHHHQHQHHNHFHQATTFNDKPYYQGQVSYYRKDDETIDDPDVGVVVADKSFHLPAKVRSSQHYGQYRRAGGGRNGGIANSYRSEEYPVRSVKWPHLRRIEYQITKDERREQDENDDEGELPPYIRKYNRRNKQLLDLLEGTIPPPTTTTFSAAPIPAMVQYSDFNDDDSERRNNRKHSRASHPEGRTHYHNHKNPKWIMEDLFEEQRANPNNPKIEDDQYPNDSLMPSKSPTSAEAKRISDMDYKNVLKRKDFSDEDEDSIENMSKDEDDEHLKSIQQNELPTRSVISDLRVSEKTLSGDGKSSQKDAVAPPSKTGKPGDNLAANSVASPTETLKISPKANQFIYHRVASSRSVGTGTNIRGVDGGSRKQRLPFVAITDRRLEMSKMQKPTADFQQNHLPLP
ncbi:unnamed protein product [Hermetia illucens]|uniref:Uncharacterized protein n=1 Tax=Hermetia illucens TaxID=343691 RepID=A0A7R8Z1E1_HERIL|nr:unnamed protein product [Hermetia illucens]